MEEEKVLKTLRERFEKEPFAKKFGIEIIELKNGYASVSMDVKPDMDNIFNMAHGGAVFSVIDAAFELAGNSSGVMSVALSMNVSYTRAAGAGDVLKAEAIEANSTRRTGLFEKQPYMPSIATSRSFQGSGHLQLPTGL